MAPPDPRSEAAAEAQLLTIQVANELESIGLYANAIDRFAREPDGRHRENAVRSIDLILRRIEESSARASRPGG